jgi:hypothetical protein|tara:strand:+ start:754 stop:933 length:180 start_codon:yes stop_codon:yes gene_type:complete
MRYYWEALFSVEYFPYWEFSMLMMLVLVLSVLWRINRIERKLDGLIDDMWHVIKDIAED